MLIPQRRLLAIVGVWTGLGVVAAFVPAAGIGWQVLGAILAGAAAADAWVARRIGSGLEVRREAPRALSVGLWHSVALAVTARTHAVSGVILDRVPPGAELEHERQPFSVPRGAVARLSYRLRPFERGNAQLGPLDIRLNSPLGLWHTQQTVGDATAIRVYPDFARIAQYTWLATDNRLSQIGVLQRRRRGQGLEFHQLRDYRQDDSPRHIDWSATARARRLIAREYQDERDQQIVLVLDCGQRMRAKDGAMSHFDHALNALLLLAYVALRQGDAVGVGTFAHDRPRFLPPRKSIATVSSLMHGLFDLQPSLQTPDYLDAATTLGRRLTKRTLIVLATTVRDEDGEALQQAARILRRKHAVVVASLREGALTRAKERPIANLEDALVYAAATDYLERRRRTIATLRRAGVQIVDVPPAGLARQLVNHYWELKRAGAA
jgi:uncharacterized protein (DUF58 family)